MASLTSLTAVSSSIFCCKLSKICGWSIPLDIFNHDLFVKRVEFEQSVLAVDVCDGASSTTTYINFEFSHHVHTPRPSLSLDEQILFKI